MKSILQGFLILLLLPLLFLGLTAAYVLFSQPSPGGDLLTCSVDRPIVWPGKKVEVLLKFNGDLLKSDKEKVPAYTTDLVLVIDRSGSMGDGETGSPLAEALTAAANFTSILGCPALRIGVVAFGSTPDTIHEISSDSQSVCQAMRGISGGGETDIAAALSLADQEFSKVPVPEPPVGRRALILLSDGGHNAPTEVIKTAQEIRRRGIDIFAIGLGEGIDESLLQQIASLPQYYSRTLDPKQLAPIYLQFGENLVEKLGDAGETTEKVNTYLFYFPEASSPLLTQYDPEHGILGWSFPILFPRQMTLSYAVKPRCAGVLTPAICPARMSYITVFNESKKLESGRHPKILSLTWPFLILLFLPALLYVIYKLLKMLLYLLRPKGVINKVKILPPQYAEPPALINLPTRTMLAQESVPTLFIGLGGSGRCILTHTKHIIQEIFQDKIPQEFQFFCLDCASREYEGEKKLEVRMGDAELENNEILCLPFDLRERVQQIKNRENPASHVDWFNPARYEGISRESFNLASGSRRQRGLARLGLLLDLEKGEEGSKVYESLKSRIGQLLQQDSPDRTYQVFLVGSADGGVGSGWFIDIAYLVHRISREITTDKNPYLYGILWSQENHPSSQPERANLIALLTELDRFSFAGEFSFPINYGKNLQGRIDSPLFSRIYFFPSEDGGTCPASMQRDFSQVADFLSLFCEKNALRNLIPYFNNLSQAERSERRRLREYTISSASAYSVRFPVREMVKRLKYQFILHLFNRQMFLDLRETDNGKVSYCSAPDEELTAILKEWKEQPFLEQDCPEFFQGLREYSEKGIPDLLVRYFNQIATSEDYDTWLQNEAGRYSGYLQGSLTSYLKGNQDKAGHSQTLLRCGRIVKIYQLVTMLLDRTKKLQNHQEIIPGGLNALDKKWRKGLIDLYLRINGEMLEELDGWINLLVAGKDVKQLRHGDRPTEESLYEKVARHYEEIREFENKALHAISSRWYMKDNEGWKELSEERLFSKFIAPWIDGIDGLRTRLWFEAAPSQTSDHLAPALHLVFLGETRKLFSLGPDSAKELLSNLENLCDRLTSPIWRYSLAQKLTGEVMSETFLIDPQLITQNLLKGKPVTTVSDPYLKTCDAKGMSFHCIFEHSTGGFDQDAPERLYSQQVYQQIKKNLGDKWQQDSCDTHDIHGYRLFFIQDNFPIFAVQSFANSIDKVPMEKIEHIYEPEVYLQNYLNEFIRVSGQSKLRIHPLLGMAVMNPARFRLFNLLYALGRIKLRRSSGMSGCYIAELNMQAINLTEEGDPPPLFEAALRFTSGNYDFEALEEEIHQIDYSARMACLEQFVKKIEREVIEKIKSRRELSLDDQLYILLYVESHLERRRG